VDSRLCIGRAWTIFTLTTSLLWSNQAR